MERRRRGTMEFLMQPIDSCEWRYAGGAGGDAVASGGGQRRSTDRRGGVQKGELASDLGAVDGQDESASARVE
uniref:Uncharacterized protein n=1 Tax=Aegilops tauschii TaxID=37682 RepID=M8BRE0_AEGTA